MKHGDKLWKSMICIGGLMILGLIGRVPGAAGDPRIDSEKLVNAIYIAEGGKRAKKPFGILSVPCVGYEDCKSVCRNTVRNNGRRWRNSNSHEDFISWLGARYAPISAHPLNKNWVKNVKYHYQKQGGVL